jgi:hypothetical protein
MHVTIEGMQWLGYNKHMKKNSLITNNRISALLCGALTLANPIAIWANTDDLPVPILPDAVDAQGMTTAHNLGELVPTSTVRWAVQLGSGNARALEKQAADLRRDWSDARVVTIFGQSKLLVGSWDTPAQASAALKALRLINAQAFVRQLPPETESVVVQPSAVPVPDAVTSPRISSEQLPVEALPEEHPSTPIESKVEAKPVAIDLVEQPKTEAIVSSDDPLKDDDVLPAIVAVALATHPEPNPEDAALKAAIEQLDGNTTMTTESQQKQTNNHSDLDVLAVLEQEKKGLALPMRSKEQPIFKPAQAMVEPLNLMLSPLYLLPMDATSQAQNPQALSMKMILEALIQPNLSSPVEPQAKQTAIAVTDENPTPVVSKKMKLFTRIAELANEGLWEMALPLAKEVRQLDEKSFSSVDHLLLGWVWLQNKDPRMAKTYFKTSLMQQPQDEARYALALCHLLLGNKQAVQGVMQEMSAGRQKSHLQQLLSR